MIMLLRILQLDVVSGGCQRERCYALQVENISGVRLESVRIAIERLHGKASKQQASTKIRYV